VDYNSTVPVMTEITQILSFKKFLELGAGIVPGKAWNVLTKINVNSQCFIAYSLDVYTGDLSRLDKGSHELTIAYIFKYNTHAPDTRLLPSK
jgi:hypothetical protein